MPAPASARRLRMRRPPRLVWISRPTRPDLGYEGRAWALWPTPGDLSQSVAALAPEVRMPSQDAISAAVRAALAPVTSITGDRASAIVRALRQAPVHLGSLDRRGRADGDDGEEPIILTAETPDQEEEAEIAVMGSTVRACLDTLAAEGDRGSELAEVLRRSHGIAGPEETLVEIARTGLQSTGRRVSRSAVAALRDEASAALRAAVLG